MKKYQRVPGGYLVEDDTTIYEVDLDCYQCLSYEEKDLFFDEQEREYAKTVCGADDFVQQPYEQFEQIKQ